VRSITLLICLAVMGGCGSEEPRVSSYEAVPGTHWPEEPFTVRGHEWGATMESVRAIEGQPSHTNKSDITYELPLGGEKWETSFFFDDKGGLVGAIYGHQDSESRTPGHAKKFAQLRDRLIRDLSEKYGKHTEGRLPPKPIGLDDEQWHAYWKAGDTAIDLSTVTDKRSVMAIVVFIDLSNPQAQKQFPLMKLDEYFSPKK
jgi:hypothetical protein